MTFIYVPVDGIETDAAALADGAVDRLKARWDGWEPNEGDPEVVVIEELAPMAANAAEATVRVPPAVLRTVATKLHGITYTAATPARGTLTINLNTPHDIPAGAEFD